MLKINTKIIFFFMAVIGLLIFLHAIKILSPVESLLAKAFSPAASGLHSASSSARNFFSQQSDTQVLQEKIGKLEKEVENLMVKNAYLNSLEEENKILHEYLSFHDNSDIPFVIGEIISRTGLDSNQPRQTIVINRGSQSGIKEGAAVISSEGMAIGKIVAVKENLSEACLVTDGNCKLAVTLQNRDKTAGIIQGELGLTIKMGFIPQTEEVNVGDLIVTSGLERNIPRGLVVGRVSEVSKESNELWQSAVIEPAVNLEKLIIVSVLLPD